MKPVTKYKIGIFSLAMMTMSLLIVVPTLAFTARDYPEMSVTVIMYLTALPTLFAIPAALAAGPLSKAIGSRNVGLLALALFVFSGIAIPFLTNYSVIMVMRCFNGLALGLIRPAGNMLIAQLFTPNERPGVTGLQGTMGNLTGIAFSLLSGVIAGTAGWRACYWLYAIALPLFIIVWLTLPGKAAMRKIVEERAASASAASKESASVGAGSAALAPAIVTQAKKSFNWGYWWILFLVLICMTCAPVIGSNMSMHIINNDYGDASMVGIATSVNVLVAAILGIFYGKLSKRTKRFNYTIGPVVMGIGLGIVGLANSFTMVLIGQAIAGIGWIYVQSENILMVFGNTTPANRAIGVSILVALVNFAQFLSPNVLVPVTHFILGDTPGERFIVAACGMVIVGVLNVFIDPKKANKGLQET